MSDGGAGPTARRILIVGGGFAGVWAAAAAARARRLATASPRQLAITLVSRTPYLDVRPRLYEAKPQDKRLALDDILTPVDVDCRQAEVTQVVADAGEVLVRAGQGETFTAERLVLAAGSQLVAAQVESIDRPVFNVDTLPAAVDLDRHLQSLGDKKTRAGQWTIVIVGSGFTGTELATELPRRLRDCGAPTDRIRILMIERAPVAAPELGEEVRNVILKAYAAAGVELRTACSVQSADREVVVLSSGERIAAQTLVRTAGMRASPLTADLGTPLDRCGRLPVDDYLRVTGRPTLYAAGDVADARSDDGRGVMQSCQHALAMGRFAGHNAAADLLGLDRVRYRQPFYVTCLDLGDSGAAVSIGWERRLARTGVEAKRVKRHINQVLIYPPCRDAEALLEAAAPVVPTEAMALARLTL